MDARVKPGHDEVGVIDCVDGLDFGKVKLN
jgi:hypothetical protein